MIDFIARCPENLHVVFADRNAFIGFSRSENAIVGRLGETAFEIQGVARGETPYNILNESSSRATLHRKFAPVAQPDRATDF